MTDTARGPSLTPGMTTILDQPWQIELISMQALKHRLRLQAVGLRFTGRSTLNLCKTTYGIHARTYADAAAQLQVLIDAREDYYGVPR